MTVRYGWSREDHDDVAVAPPPVHPRRRRRIRIAGAAVVAVVLVTAGVAAWLTFTDAHRSPRAVAEAFLTANERHDWAASWELLCRSEQLRHESFAMWSDVQDLRVEIRSPALEGETVTVEDVRPNERSARPSYVIDLEHDLGSAVYFDTLLVVEEDGEYRACGQP
ncbi:hypothetical protein GCM10027451_32610 [Geodermatophilus aquaeductus]